MSSTNTNATNTVPKFNTSQPRRERTSSDERSRAITTTSVHTSLTTTLNNISPFRSLNPVRRKSDMTTPSTQQQYHQVNSINEDFDKGKQEFLEDSDDEILDGDATVKSSVRGGGTDVAKRPQFDLAAAMYKRRGGLGRNAENNW